MRLQVVEQFAFGVAVGGGDVVQGDAVQGDAGGVAEVEGVFAPAGDVFVEDAGHVLAGPCDGVDAVGDGVDVVAGEHERGDFAVALGDAVDVVAEVQAGVGHVEHAVVDEEAAAFERALLFDDGVDLVHCEAVVPGGDDRTLACAVQHDQAAQFTGLPPTSPGGVVG